MKSRDQMPKGCLRVSFSFALIIVGFFTMPVGLLFIAIGFFLWALQCIQYRASKASQDAQKETPSTASYSPSQPDPELEKEIKRRREEFLQKKLRDAQEELNSLPRYPITISTEKRKRKTGYEEPTFSNITAKGKYNEFVVFDTETTGLAPSKERIIELAAIRFVDGSPTEIFETYINPGKPIPPEATAINHITDEMVADAPTISQILPAFEAFVGRSPLVAHNLAFDLKFMYYSGSNLMESPRKYFDTLQVAQKMLKKPKYKYDEEFGTWEKDYDSAYDVYDHKLETLADYYNITCPDQHRAASDAIVAGKLFLKLIDDKQTYWSSSI